MSNTTSNRLNPDDSSPTNTNTVKAIFLLIALVIAVTQIHDCKEKAKTEKAAAVNYSISHPPPAQIVTQPVEALVLMHECFTPCSANIAWKFKIRTDGHGLDIKWNGVAEPFHYPAEGDFAPPPQMLSGTQSFTSSDKVHPNVRVQVYKRITVQGGR